MKNFSQQKIRTAKATREKIVTSDWSSSSTMGNIATAQLREIPVQLNFGEYRYLYCIAQLRAFYLTAPNKTQRRVKTFVKVHHSIAFAQKFAKKKKFIQKKPEWQNYNLTDLPGDQWMPKGKQPRNSTFL